MAQTLLDQLLGFMPVEELRGRAEAYVASRYDLDWDGLAADVTHDVLAVFLRRPALPSLEEEKKAFAYLFRSLDQRAVYYLTRFLRDPKRHLPIEEDLTPSTEREPLEKLLGEEGKVAARRQVELLLEVATTEQAEILRLLRDGLPTTQIALTLQIATSTVRMRLHFLRKRVRRLEERPWRSPKGKVEEPLAPTPIAAAVKLDTSAA